MRPFPNESPQQTQAQMSLLAEHGDVSLMQLAQLSAVPEAELVGLLDYGVLNAVSAERQPRRFSAGSVAILRRAKLLREDLALDQQAFALAVMFLGEVIGLETEVLSLQARLSQVSQENFSNGRKPKLHLA